MNAAPGLDVVAAAAHAAGLRVRGAFHPVAGDEVPALPDGAAAGTVVLLGNTGRSLWAVFAASPEAQGGGAHPLDAWSRRVIGALAATLGAMPIYPFRGPPWLPFQRWAMRAEPVWPSPIGPLVHSKYGLWHAYRGALVFGERFALPRVAPATRPCDACVARPCLHTCPAGALGEGGYDVPACAAHLESAGGAACREGGCLARRACPAGREYAYAVPQQVFHMAAFIAARRREAV